MALGSFYFSLMSVLVKYAGRTIPSQEIVFFRSLVTMALSYYGLRKLGLSPWGNNRRLLILRASAGFVAMSCMYYALTRLPLAETNVISFLSPMFLVVIAALFLGEPMRRREVLGVLACLAGVVLITRPDFLFGEEVGTLDALGVLAALGSAFFSAIAKAAIRGMRGEDHPYVIIFFFTLIAAPFSLPIVLKYGVMPGWRELLLFVGIGVFAQLGQYNMTTALHLETANRASSVTYFGIVYSYLWGVLLFAEEPSLWSVLGAAIIVGSIVSIARGGDKKRI